MEQHNEERKIGRHMFTIMWIIVLAGLTYLFTKIEEYQRNPNQTFVSTEKGGVQEITLKRNRYHHYVASGMINSVPVVFILDTGATNVAVPEHLAKVLQLKKGMPGYAVTANGTVEIHDTTINELQLGPFIIKNVNASINPGMEQDEILLGMSVLKQLDFSQTNDNLTLRQQR